MGAIFSFASAAPDVAMAPAEQVGSGLRVTFAVAAVLIVIGLGLALVTRASGATTPDRFPR